MCLSVNGTSTSWSNDDDLPWLTRRDTDRHSHHSDGPSSSSSRLPLPPSAWLDPETVVPPPGRVERRLGVTTAGDLRPRDTDRHRHRLTTASRRRLTDKFDELDEEAMSPFTWQSQPATVSQVNDQGRRHGFESGGTILRAERAKIFFYPPTFWPVGGDKILLR